MQASSPILGDGIFHSGLDCCSHRVLARSLNVISEVMVIRARMALLVGKELGQFLRSIPRTPVQLVRQVLSHLCSHLFLTDNARQDFSDKSVNKLDHFCDMLARNILPRTRLLLEELRKKEMVVVSGELATSGSHIDLHVLASLVLTGWMVRLPA